MNRGPIAEIDLSSLQHNLKSVRKIVSRRPIIAVVKADAYGHGAVEVSRKLLSEGVTILAVAFTGEAKVLREAGITQKILVLFDHDPIEDYFVYGLTPVIHNIKSASEFSKEARRRKTRIPVHIKIDTGMGRGGFRSSEAVSSAKKISVMEGIAVEGILSHFSEADLSDRSYATRQIEIFDSIRLEISALLGRQVISHMGNSAAVLTLKDGLFDAVRPGIMLYGYSPVKKSFGLKPLMRVKTRVLMIRKFPAGSPVSYGRTFITKRSSKIAVLPIGYADGYDRLFSNNAEVLIGGRRVPVVGRVCMDLTMADVTEVESVSEGDEVVILGRQGKNVITATELSSRINTIPYEILLSLGSRAEKEYIS